jgi:hypothetical protein
MAAVTLPGLHRSTEFTIREISRDREMSPILGGDEALIQRPGTKHEIVVTIPAIASAGCGPALVAALALGKSAGAVMPIPEPKVQIMPYGAPRVNGGGQLGSSLVIDGLTPGVIVPAGKWLSVIVSNRRYAYYTTAEVVADSGGNATLPIYPMIRGSAADNAVVELAAPMIEGLVKMTERDVRRIGALSFSFTIRERG